MGNQRKREKKRKRKGGKWNYKRMKRNKNCEKYISVCCSEILVTVFLLLFLNTMKMLSRGQHNHVNLSLSKKKIQVNPKSSCFSHGNKLILQKRELKRPFQGGFPCNIQEEKKRFTCSQGTFSLFHGIIFSLRTLAMLPDTKWN